ncbi:MAG: Nif3-like dinuclear metal center hexameric protein [Ignavibacteriae bacterium]|nr:Nif3-like dinuclear metal center hexameric protein [Ignavibacteriota bacterium]MCB9217078.1 Nif3-like dinuclear metal center hexameric protein [Ignavibacteria bacterium]
MRITHFLEHLDTVIPINLAMQDDPVGLQVMAEDRELTKVVVAYELNETIVLNAANEGAELIVAFHPLIYPHLRSITGKDRVERTVLRLIENRIGLYIVHTAFDAHPRGTSWLLANALGCTNIRPIVPNALLAGAGMGAVGKLVEPTPLSKLSQQVKEVCGTPVVRVSAVTEMDRDPNIATVAILGGSGMSFYGDALSCGADAFITADTRYHAFHAANDGIPILDPGHAESERFVVEGIATLINELIEQETLAVEVIPLHIKTNPIHYIV